MGPCKPSFRISRYGTIKISPCSNANVSRKDLTFAMVTSKYEWKILERHRKHYTINQLYSLSHNLFHPHPRKSVLDTTKSSILYILGTYLAGSNWVVPSCPAPQGWHPPPQLLMLRITIASISGSSKTLPSNSTYSIQRFKS